MPDTVDKVLDHCHATTSSLDPCLAWLIKAARPITTEWPTAIINGSFLEGKFPLLWEGGEKAAPMQRSANGAGKRKRTQNKIKVAFCTAWRGVPPHVDSSHPYIYMKNTRKYFTELYYNVYIPLIKTSRKRNIPRIDN